MRPSYRPRRRDTHTRELSSADAHVAAGRIERHALGRTRATHKVERREEHRPDGAGVRERDPRDARPRGGLGRGERFGRVVDGRDGRR